MDKPVRCLCKKPKVAELDRQEKIKAFRAANAWTGDERKDFRISGAIFTGWLISTGDRGSYDNLIGKSRGKQGVFDWVYKFECPKCGSVDVRGITRRLSQYQYDRLPEDEARATLLGVNEMKKCPNCNQFVEFKKVKKRNQQWAMVKHIRKMNRIRERGAHGILVTLDQFKMMDEPNNAWNTVIVPRWKQLITNRFPNGAEVDGWLQQAKPYLEDIYRTFPVETKLCARPDCLNPLPRGSWKNRLYCSGQCQAIQKSRRARRK